MRKYKLTLTFGSLAVAIQAHLAGLISSEPSGPPKVPKSMDCFLVPSCWAQKVLDQSKLDHLRRERELLNSIPKTPHTFGEHVHCPSRHCVWRII
jgi:hypothetical protein